MNRKLMFFIQIVKFSSLQLSKTKMSFSSVTPNGLTDEVKRIFSKPFNHYF